MNTKKAISAMTTILMLTLTTMMILPSAFGQGSRSGSEAFLVLPVNIPTYLMVSCAPNPIGVGQQAYLMAVFSKPVPTSHGLLGDMYEGITIEVTDPDGQKIVLGPYDGGMIGGVSVAYTPSKVGEYKVQAFYPGETLDGMNPYNRDASTMDYHPELVGSKMLPSQSQIEPLIVQEEAVGMNYQTPPLPTEYWTRPIFALNWNWGNEIGSNWLGLAATGFCSTGRYDATGGLQPYGTAPNSAHILWSKSTKDGGQPGGPIPADPSTQYMSTTVVVNMYDGAIIMNGVIYYTLHSDWSGQIIGMQALDLKTGEVIWTKEGTDYLKNGFIFRAHNPQEYGAWQYLMTTAVGGKIKMFDAFTGSFVCNLTDARQLNFIIHDDPNEMQIGALLGWYTSGGNLYRWNSTQLFTTIGSNLQARTRIQANREYNWTLGVDQVIPLPTENDLNATLGVTSVTKEVILLTYRPSFYYQGTNFGWFVSMGIDAITGAKLWGPLNQTLPIFEDISVSSARDGIYVMLNKDLHSLTGYSLTTGQKVWGPSPTIYNANSVLDAYTDIAYGKVFYWDTGGIVQAFDYGTGAPLWNWTRGPSGYDDPRGTYEIFGYNPHSIADGRLFLREGFSYTPPLHPARRFALDCETGELVWEILSYSSRSGSPVADGCLVEWDEYDCKIYTFGKGPTATTVSAPNLGAVFGSSVVISGTVMDISAGTKQDEQAARFPHGVPAVSDESMSTWMEYVYKQQNKPADCEGVEVSIDVVDSNGNYRNIGTATSDVNGYFSFDWQPDITGKYTVVATFMGSESYYGSQAEAAFVVDAAPEPTTAPTPAPASLADQYLLPATGGIIAAIAIVGVALALLLRKR